MEKNVSLYHHCCSVLWFNKMLPTKKKNHFFQPFHLFFFFLLLSPLSVLFYRKKFSYVTAKAKIRVYNIKVFHWQTVNVGHKKMIQNFLLFTIFLQNYKKKIFSLVLIAKRYICLWNWRSYLIRWPNFYKISIFLAFRWKTFLMQFTPIQMLSCCFSLGIGYFHRKKLFFFSLVFC